jgi:hypothetical protein
MIGVVSKKDNQAVVEEFFQLFKTPWEFYDPKKRYEVLIVPPGDIPDTDSSLIIICGAETSIFDPETKAENKTGDLFITWKEIGVPIYDEALTFRNAANPILDSNKPGQAAGFEITKSNQKCLRIGYDLFKEVYHLLTRGQPAENALIPTLDLHIEMLRTWICEAGIEFIEIPPVPHGFNFIVCLTHDVDFIGIRYHFGDHSMWGFLYRASLGSLLKFFKGKIDLKKLFLNLISSLKLPLVYLSLCKDPWDQFDRYLEIEKGLGGTYFFIPFKNRYGVGFDMKKDRYRAAKYDLDDTDFILPKLLANGCELGVHGIDAWHSIEKGKEELQRVQDKTGSSDGIGIRMHWLAGDERTFEVLDKTGFSYDSSVGYNETIGFKAGTCQVFKPIQSGNLLEIPLIIQDSALFGEGRMNISENQASTLCERIIDTVNRVKGVLTILWHQRSLGPERLWGNFYVELLTKLNKPQIWFATANDIERWFKIRRAVKFEAGKPDGADICLDKNNPIWPSPPLSIRIHSLQRLGNFEQYDLDTYLKMPRQCH